MTDTASPSKVAKRITFGLTHRGEEALDYLAANTGYNLTDTLNRALERCAEIERGSTEGSLLALVKGDPLGDHTLVALIPRF